MIEREERERRYEQQEWLVGLSDEDYQRYEDEQLGRRAVKVIGLILFLVWLLWIGFCKAESGQVQQEKSLKLTLF